MRPLILWHILGAHLLLIWGVGVVEIGFIFGSFLWSDTCFIITLLSERWWFLKTWRARSKSGMSPPAIAHFFLLPRKGYFR